MQGVLTTYILIFYMVEICFTQVLSRAEISLYGTVSIVRYIYKCGKWQHCCQNLD